MRIFGGENRRLPGFFRLFDTLSVSWSKRVLIDWALIPQAYFINYYSILC